MKVVSRPVSSAQATVHDHLLDRIRRQQRQPFARPVGAAARQAWETLHSAWDGCQPLVLDAACGTGVSTYRLAARHEDAFVLGVDQSVARLGRACAEKRERHPRVLLLRADLIDFWRLLRSEGVRLARHYLLYPNPWPKIGHLGRRWHGHPVFPDLLALGGVLECRSNWPLYVEEHVLAVRTLTGRCPAHGLLPPVTTDEGALSPFEAKYAASGHPLAYSRVDLADWQP